jgi:hypothetical protein
MEAAPPMQVPIQASNYSSYEHQLKVNGTDYIHTLEVVVTIDRDGKEFKKTIEVKKIGDEPYKVSRLMVDSKECEECHETNLTSAKLADFKLNWEKNWKPTQWREPNMTD